MEYIDVLDKEGKPTGEKKSYQEIHERGLLHKAVHVWILNSKKELLLQKRSMGKGAYPGYWDISAAGHVSAGQTSLEAAQRETEEEIGLNVPASEFILLFTLEEHIVLNGGKFINNDFHDIYLVKKDVDISDTRFTDGEVSAVKFLSIEEFKKWVKREGELMVPHEEEYRKLLEYIEKN